MSVSEKIKDQLMSRAKGVKVRDVRIGLGYTAVLLENGQAGLAFTFNESMKKGCTIFTGLHPLAGRDASELLAFLGSDDKIEMAVALATQDWVAAVAEASIAAAEERIAAAEAVVAGNTA